MLDKRIEFDESYIDEAEGTITLYFIVPKDLFPEIDEEAEHAEISIECPIGNLSANHSQVQWSPTKWDGYGYTDYDWTDISMPYEEIEAFIKLAEESERMMTL